MIQFANKQECCGCASCVQRCPKQCIRMVEDCEGFLYPEVDETTCIECGICEKVCPLLHRADPLPIQQVLAVKNRNEEERLASSSGGVFIALAKVVLQQEGVVFGAVYDEHWEVRHTYAEDLDGVKAMMGSKYLQSRMEHAYQDAERFLKKGREVLFTGTPCQITGLHAFLRKDYPNLLAVDFLCHGVPSPDVWRRYLHETFFNPPVRAAAGRNTVLSLSLKDIPSIEDISFRDKNFNGWKKFSFVVRGKSASKADKNSVLLSDIHKDNPYMRGFLKNIYLRPSCYHCHCKNGVSHSDITIADFWGINRLMPDFDDDKGTGLVLISSKKGVMYFSQLDMEVQESNLSIVMNLNEGFHEKHIIHPKRAYFYQQIHNGRTISETVEECLRVSMARKGVLLLKRILRKCLKMCGIRLSNR